MSKQEHPTQPVVLVDGVVRFKPNAILRKLVDLRAIDLNQITPEDFPPEDREQFWQLLGYSVSAFGSLSFVRKETAEQADVIADYLLRGKTPREKSFPQAMVCTAKDWVHANLDEGVTCPCCTQFAKRYKRKLNSNMAHALILIHHEQKTNNNDWLHVPSFLSSKIRGATVRGGDWAKLVYWGLIVGKTGQREDGSTRVGFYKITGKGREFVTGKTSVPKYAFLYADRCTGMSDDLTTIHESLGEKFDYRELMDGRPSGPNAPAPFVPR